MLFYNKNRFRMKILEIKYMLNMTGNLEISLNLFYIKLESKMAVDYCYIRTALFTPWEMKVLGLTENEVFDEVRNFLVRNKDGRRVLSILCELNARSNFN